MDRRHPWLRVVFVLLFVLGIGKSLRDLSNLADRADDPNPRPAHGALFDFRDTAFNPSRDLLDGDNPYDHEDYLARHRDTQEFDAYVPSWFSFAIPVAVLPYRVGQVVWWFSVAGGVVALAWLSLRAASIDVDPYRVAGLAGVLYLCLAGLEVMRSGQQAFTWACALLVCALWRERWPWVAALCLLLLASKPQFLIPIGVCLALGSGAWRLVLRGAVLVIAAALVPLGLLIAAAGSVGDLVTSVRDNVDYSSKIQNDLSESSDVLRADIANAFGKLDIAQPSTGLQLVIAAIVLTLAVLALRRTPSSSALMYVVLSTAVIVSFPHYPYDLAITIPAVVMLVAGARGAGALPPVMRWGLAALLVVPLSLTYQVDRVIDAIGVPSGMHQALGSLSVAAAFLLAVGAALSIDGRAAAGGGRVRRS